MENFDHLMHWICNNQNRPKIYSVIPLYLIFSKVNGYFEYSIVNNYLTLLPTNESKGKIKKVSKTMD